MSRIRPSYRLPEDKAKAMRRAKRLAWWALWWTFTIVAVIGLTMSTSQAMETAFVEDLLTMLPPASFLIARYVAVRRRPSARFPFGYYRLSTIAFFASTVTLFGMGVYLLSDALATLVRQEEPEIGQVELFGEAIWFGWLMIAANVYAGVVPYILSRKEEPVAREVHEKVLYASARLHRADWLTAAAAAGGVIGIGLGYWWADAAAAVFISLDIIRDGWRNLMHSLSDLMDEVPTPVGSSDPDPVLDRVTAYLSELDWIASVQVRLREEGQILTGDAQVVPRDERGLLRRMAEAQVEVERLDWRLYDFAIIPVYQLSPSTPSGAAPAARDEGA